MMTAEQIFLAIQGLPPSERRVLLDRLGREVGEPTPDPPAAEDQGPSLIGFLADDPALADEIEKIATNERAGEDLRSWTDAPGRSR